MSRMLRFVSVSVLLLLPCACASVKEDTETPRANWPLQHAMHEWEFDVENAHKEHERKRWEGALEDSIGTQGKQLFDAWGVPETSGAPGGAFVYRWSKRKESHSGGYSVPDGYAVQRVEYLGFRGVYEGVIETPKSRYVPPSTVVSWCEIRVMADKDGKITRISHDGSSIELCMRNFPLQRSRDRPDPLKQNPTSAQAQSNLTTIQSFAEQGNAAAQAYLGYIYALGRGVPQDAAKAAQWYQQAAAQGIAGAQCSLGLLYAAGLGVSKDEAKAVQLYKQAIKRGDDHLQRTELGFSSSHFRFRHGNEYAQGALGLMYLGGRGVPRNRHKGCDLLRAAGREHDAFLALYDELCVAGKNVAAQAGLDKRLDAAIARLATTPP